MLLIHTIRCHIPDTAIVQNPTSNCQPQPTRRRSDLTNLAHGTNRALILGMVLDPIVRTCDTRLIRVYRRVRRSADLELGKLVEIDFDCIVGVLLAYGFDLAGLPSGKS